MSIHFCYKWRSTDFRYSLGSNKIHLYLNERELKIKMIIQWIHLYNSCDDDL